MPSVGQQGTLPFAQVFLKDHKLAWWHRQSRAHHENWLQKFFGQPCNGELFVKQSLNMEGTLPRP